MIRYDLGKTLSFMELFEEVVLGQIFYVCIIEISLVLILITHLFFSQVAAEDDFPVFVCSDCVDKLNTTHELVVMCIESNNKFNEYLKSKEEKTKPDNSVRRDVAQSENKIYETEGMVEEKQESQKKAHNSVNMKEENGTTDMSMLKFLEKEGISSCGIHKNGSLQGEMHQEQEYVLSYEDTFPSFQFSNADMIKEVDNEVLNSMENMTTLVPVPLHNTFSDMQSFDCKSSNINTMEKVVSLKLHEDGFVHCEDDFTSFQDFTKTKLPKTNESAFRHQDSSTLKPPDQCEVNRHGGGLNCPICSYTAQTQDELDSHVACCNISSSVSETPGHDIIEHDKIYTKVDTNQVHRLGHIISQGFDPEVSWSCTSCHLNFQSSERLREHRETCHATLWLCDLCGRGFSTSEELSDHHNLMHVQSLQRNSRPNVFRNRLVAGVMSQ
ncbi:uncharacterized protein LOC126467022 [Schistocerca serialis cubense]|uniref:uncharacterized protein LOC126467022 n=1 Tax=Schistocerca serialis cubense TaxID=2023355 RepID=UPI00214E5866|nr:uncharacterized protein LOC126467022 [Schistocerca serialis cubense]